MSAYYRKFRRQFGRGYYAPSRMPSGPAVVIGVVVAVAVAAAVKHDHAPGPATAEAPATVARPDVADAVIPSAGSYTPQSWTLAFLRIAGYRATRCNVIFVRAWILWEGSTWAWHDPLDDELPEPGSHRVNTTGPGQGVQAYLTWRQGFRATVRTLNGPDYQGVRAALAAGNSAEAAARAEDASPWGTHIPEASC